MPLLLRLIPQATSLHTKLVLALAILVALVAAYVLIERKRRFLELEGRAARIAELFSRLTALSILESQRRSTAPGRCLGLRPVVGQQLHPLNNRRGSSFRVERPDDPGRAH